jgi:hypothetical protein
MSKVDIFVGVSIETQEQTRVFSLGALLPQKGSQCAADGGEVLLTVGGNGLAEGRCAR